MGLLHYLLPHGTLPPRQPCLTAETPRQVLSLPARALGDWGHPGTAALRRSRGAEGYPCCAEQPGCPAQPGSRAGTPSFAVSHSSGAHGILTRWPILLLHASWAQGFSGSAAQAPLCIAALAN